MTGESEVKVRLRPAVEAFAGANERGDVDAIEFWAAPATLDG
jgi:hypothetical protein